MIYSVRGTLIYLDMNTAVIECGGVGFKCSTTTTTAGSLKMGAETTLYTYLHVREDALDLFGFADLGELHCFKMLISVSGIGPKVALSVLSSLTPDRFAVCVAAGDAKSLTRAQGGGTKLAQRIVLELQDKVKGMDTGAHLADLPTAANGMESPIGEAANALVVLGYSHSDAAVMLSGVDQSLPAGEMIRQALKAADQKRNR